MALTNMYFKTKLVSCFGKSKNRMGEEEEEEEKKKMEEPRSNKPKRYGNSP